MHIKQRDDTIIQKLWLKRCILKGCNHKVTTIGEPIAPSQTCAKKKKKLIRKEEKKKNRTPPRKPCAKKTTKKKETARCLRPPLHARPVSSRVGEGACDWSLINILSPIVPTAHCLRVSVVIAIMAVILCKLCSSAWQRKKMYSSRTRVLVHMLLHPGW